MTTDQKRETISLFIGENYKEFSHYAKKWLGIALQKAPSINRRAFLHKDLLHGVTLNILESDSDRTDKLYSMLERGELKSYIFGIIYKNCTSRNAQFIHSELKGTRADFYGDLMPAIEGEPEEEFKRRYEQQMAEQMGVDMVYNLVEVSGIDWHDAKIFKEYFQNPVSLQQLAEKYNLSRNMVFQMVKKTTDKVKAHLKALGMETIPGRG